MSAELLARESANLGDVAHNLHIRTKEIEIAGEFLLAHQVDDHVGMPHRLLEVAANMSVRSTARVLLEIKHLNYALVITGVKGHWDDLS
jgi:hypothetical protein